MNIELTLPEVRQIELAMTERVARLERIPAARRPRTWDIQHPAARSALGKIIAASVEMGR